MKISWDKIGNESFSTRDDIHWLFLEVFGGRKNDVFAVILNDDLPWWTTSFDDDFCQVPNLKLLPSKRIFDQINQKWQKFFRHSSLNFEMKPRIISYINKAYSLSKWSNYPNIIREKNPPWTIRFYLDTSGT